MAWPWSRQQQQRRDLSPAEALAQWDGAYRWAGELGPGGLTFETAGSLQAPGSLLEDIAGLSNARISRRDALKATPVLRARNLIAGVPATLPIELRDRKTRELDDRNWLGVQPHPRLETTVMLAFTFEDLFFESTSYWRITRWSEGFPIEAEHLDHRSVSQSLSYGMPSQVISEDHQFAPDDPVIVDGRVARDREIIRFMSPNPPLLVHAAKAIRTILLLDTIANGYATDPLPYGYFKDATDEDALDDEEINAVLDKWARSRREHRWGYVPSGLELESLEWPNPQQLQLVQARNHAVLDVARAAGLDPEAVGVNIEGTSRTYTNAEQRRLDLIDFTLLPYLAAVENRLSMNDVTPRNLVAQFDYSAFARADFLARMQGYRVGIAAGVFKRNEARRREGWPDLSDEEIAQKVAEDASGGVPTPPASGRVPTPAGVNGRSSSNGDGG